MQVRLSRASDLIASGKYNEACHILTSLEQKISTYSPEEQVAIYQVRIIAEKNRANYLLSRSPDYKYPANAHLERAAFCRDEITKLQLTKKDPGEQKDLFRSNTEKKSEVLKPCQSLKDAIEKTFNLTQHKCD